MALISAKNWSKLAPIETTKPLTQVGGFFNATQRRKHAFGSWGALKKPFERGAFE
jgi:hypothetical protein